MCISLLGRRLSGGSLTSHGEMRSVLGLLDAAAGLHLSEGCLSTGGFLLVVQKQGLGAPARAKTGLGEFAGSLLGEV